jgi:prophage regulatory protein
LLSVYELMMVDEIADLLGVSSKRADQMTREQGFPAPVATLSGGRIWLRRDVESWAREKEAQRIR